MITHVLDTSALLAHYFQEEGAEEVDHLFQSNPGTLGLSLVSWPEFATRLGDLVRNKAEVELAFRNYTEVLTVPLPVSVAVACKAIELRTRAKTRLPLVDSLIAATAAVEGATLVHRDPHFQGLAPALLEQHFVRRAEDRKGKKPRQ